MAAYSKTDPLGSSKLVTRTSRPTKTQELQLFTRTRTGHRKKSTSPAIHSKPVDSARQTQNFANQTRSPKPIPVGGVAPNEPNPATGRRSTASMSPPPDLADRFEAPTVSGLGRTCLPAASGWISPLLRQQVSRQGTPLGTALGLGCLVCFFFA